MNASLIAVRPGPLVTVQDTGRLGHQKSGVTPAGAIDRVAYGVANTLVGNPPDAAALELTLIGGVFRAEGGPVRIAVAGPAWPVKVGDRALAPLTSVTLVAGETVTIGAAPAGVTRGYLAVAGGINVAPVLGSRSTHVRSRIGGLDGRPLVDGDWLPLGSADVGGPELRLAPATLPAMRPRLRVVLGPQDDYFTQAAIETFLSAEYRVTTEADRMGCRLEGPALQHAGDFNIVSDGIGMGAIQVPGNGRPIVLLADRQSTGGYPKIACVISVDVWRLGQCRPGDATGFEAVDVATAQALARERAQWLAGLPDRVEPAVRADPGTEDLLAANLIDGVIDGAA